MRRTVTLSSLALLAAAVTAAPAAGDTKVASKVTLANSFPAFHGKVKSDEDVCIEDRKVKLFMKRPGKDELLGKTQTNARGRWKILRDPTSGVFYAKVMKGGSAALEIKCARDVSKLVVID